MIRGEDHHQQSAKGRETDAWGIRFPPWLITYSDLITLLLTFFILLMSMADLDPVRFTEASNSLKGAFGIRPHPAGSEVIIPVFPTPNSESNPYQRSLINNLHHSLKLEIEELDGGFKEIQTLARDSDSLLVRINESLLFAPGSDVLRETSHPFLTTIADKLEHHPIDVRIEGHADDMILEAGQFENSWELSTARAVSVLRYFVQQRLIAIERLSAVGYGDERPLAEDAKVAKNPLNRRVDIILQVNFPSGTTPAEEQRSTIPL
ncbi:MAG: OmpA/MotB family protein [Desulfocapsaceae bacterium]